MPWYLSESYFLFLGCGTSVPARKALVRRNSATESALWFLPSGYEWNRGCLVRLRRVIVGCSPAAGKIGPQGTLHNLRRVDHRAQCPDLFERIRRIARSCICRVSPAQRLSSRHGERWSSLVTVSSKRGSTTTFDHQINK